MKIRVLRIDETDERSIASISVALLQAIKDKFRSGSILGIDLNHALGSLENTCLNLVVDNLYAYTYILIKSLVIK